MARKSKPNAGSQQPDFGPAEDILGRVVSELAVYPVEAFEFVQEGLNYTVQKIHGTPTDPTNPATPPSPNTTDNSSPARPPKRKRSGPFTQPAEPASPASRDADAAPSLEPSPFHVTGRQLSLGLRDYAWMRWGFLARAVLARWNITSTYDFGRIVYALIDAGIFSKTDSDRIEDFRNVYDFRTLESHYTLPGQASPEPAPANR